MAKPELLFLSHLLPYPPDSGAASRTYNLFRELSREFQVTGLCFHRDGPDVSREELARRVEGMAPYGTMEALPIPQQGRPLRLVGDHLRSLLSWRPYTYFVHESTAFDRALASTLHGHTFALAHVDSLDLLRFMPRLEGMPIACTHHNVESALLRRRARLPGEPLWRRAYLGLQSHLLEREERRWLPRVDLNVAVSDADALQLRAMAPNARVETVHNGVDIEHFRPHPVPGPTGCVFVGGTNWFPNRDALHWHATEIAPALRQRHPGTETTWVGHATPEEQARYNGADGVRLTGYVDDIRPHVHPAACFVVPLRVGGGTRLKVLDAWAMGKAVVSTSVGCEGLRTRHGDNILIADTVEGFVECVSRVLTDPALREHLERGGRATVEANYSWAALGTRLCGLYRGLVHPPQAVAEGSGG